MTEQPSRAESHRVPAADRDHDAAADDLDSRSRRWQRTGAPSALWPGVNIAALDPAAAAIEGAVIACLNERRAALTGEHASDPRVVGIAALVLGVGPLLGYWIEQGRLEVRSDVAAVLAQHLAHGRARMRRITDGVAPALAALARAGAAPAIVKGFHTAHAYFPEPGVRPLADVDVVVAPEQRTAAERALHALGFVPQRARHPLKREWHPAQMDRRIRSLELWHAESPWDLELHVGLVFGELERYGVSFADPLHDAVEWQVAGAPVRLLAPPLRLVAAAAHFGQELSTLRLLRLIELVLSIRRDIDATQWTAVTDVLERSRAARFVYPAFALAERLVPGTIEPRILAAARAASTRLACRIVDALRPATPLLTGGVSLGHRLMWAKTPGEVLRRLGVMLHAEPGSSWSDAARLYQGRLHRFFTVRVTFGIRRGPPVV